MNMRNNTAAANRRASTRLFALSILLALAAILAISSAVPAAPPPAAPAAVPAQTTVDYDADDDGYIDIAADSHARLNAIRYDLNGDGNPETGGTSGTTAYNTAFPNRVTSASGRMGCPGGNCVGYELLGNINLDTNGNGSHDSGDAYYYSGEGWRPIGTNATRFTANFKGNGHAVQNLTISRTGSAGNDQGLFGSVDSGARIESLGVTSASVSGGNQYAGILAAINRGTIVACYTTGSVSSTAFVGGLVGWTGGTSSSAKSTISTSYSHASVSGNNRVGGLTGSMNNQATITNSYSIGSVTVTGTSSSFIGGLNGRAVTGSTVTASYWNTTTSGQSGSAGGGGQTTTALQGGTTYAGIFSDWNINLRRA